MLMNNCHICQIVLLQYVPVGSYLLLSLAEAPPSSGAIDVGDQSELDAIPVRKSAGLTIGPSTSLMSWSD